MFGHSFRAAALLPCVLSCAAAAANLDGGIVFGSQIAGSDELITIDSQTADWTLVGPMNQSTSMTGLAYAQGSDMLFGVDLILSGLFSVDQSTGGATLIGDLAFDEPVGLAYDASRDVLYASTMYDALYEVDPDTGSSSFIGAIGGGLYGPMEGLAYDPLLDVLYGLSDEAQAILSIDVHTADATVLDVALPDDQYRGITYDTDLGLLYVTSVTPTLFYRVDLAQGMASYVGELVDASAVHGLAYKPIPAPPGLIALGIAMGAIRSRRR